jgi:hypothetical protein
MSTDALQAWGLAVQLNGGNLQTLQGFFEKLASTRDKALKGGEAEIELFAKYGIAIDDLKGKRIEDIGLHLAKVMKGGDTQKVLADLRSLGGKQAGGMAAAFSSGNILDILESSGQMGTGMSGQAIGQIGDADDWWTIQKAQMKSSIAPWLGWGKKAGSRAADFTLSSLAALPNAIIGGFKGDMTMGEGFMFDFKARAKARDIIKGSNTSRNDGGDEFDSPEAKAKREEEAQKAKEKADKAKKKADKEIADAKKKEATLDEQARREVESELRDNAKFGKHDVSGEQRVGQFLGNFGIAASPEMAAMNAQVRSEEHLRVIRERLDKKRTASGLADPDPVF